VIGKAAVLGQWCKFGVEGRESEQPLAVRAPVLVGGAGSQLITPLFNGLDAASHLPYASMAVS
jgi:hypothetical protein